MRVNIPAIPALELSPWTVGPSGENGFVISNEDTFLTSEEAISLLAGENVDKTAMLKKYDHIAVSRAENGTNILIVQLGDVDEEVLRENMEKLQVQYNLVVLVLKLKQYCNVPLNPSICKDGVEISSVIRCNSLPTGLAPPLPQYVLNNCTSSNFGPPSDNLLR